MRRNFFIAVMAMGFSGLVAEILVLRELLIVFSGNELCIGIILANWLILEAFGCFLPGRMAKKSGNRLEIFAIITILFSLALPVAIILARLIKTALNVSIGESIGLVPMFYASFLILMPVSILHGALFTFSCRIYSEFSGRIDSSAGRIYIYETVGTIVGGIVCTYLLIPYLNSLDASLWLAAANLAICLSLLVPYWKTGPFQKTVLIILSGLILLTGYVIVAGLANKLHNFAINAQWKNQNVVHYQNSPYGNICIVENEGQYIFFLDGVPDLITPVPDMQFVEEFVNIPLLAHPKPKAILVLSNGAGGVINEALKHPSIESIKYAELDPLLLELLRKFPTPLTASELNDTRVQVKHIDGSLLLKTSQNKYDVILVGIDEPSNLQANRFFTKEFFSLARKKLNKEGIMVLRLPGSLTYSTDELKNLNSSIFHTLKRVFANIRVIPGDGNNLFLSSDSKDVQAFDGMQLKKRLNQLNLKADLVVPWRIENKLHQGWQSWFDHFIEESSQMINTDFKPIGLFYSISHWNALFGPSLRPLFVQFEKVSLKTVAVLPVILLVLYFSLRKRSKKIAQAGIPLSIITTGFAGMLFDLMLIFAFQTIYGYVFSWIGLLVAFFMAGTACGAMWTMKALASTKNLRKLYTGIELAIVCWSFGWPLVFLVVQTHLDSWSGFFFSKMMLLFISLVCGLLVGSQFPLANKIYLKNNTSVSKTAGLLYASDLLGGWFGGIAGAVVLLPVLGFIGTGITVGLLKLSSFIVVATGLGWHPQGGKT